MSGYNNGMKQFLTPVQSKDIKIKEWLIYNQEDSVTSAIQYLYTNQNGEHIIAVGRAFCSPLDQFSRKEGRTKALKRLRKFIDRGRESNFKHYTEWSGRDEDKASFPYGATLFESGKADILTPEELAIYKKSFLPKIDRYVFDTGYTVVELSSIVDWKTDKYVQEMVGSAN